MEQGGSGGIHAVRDTASPPGTVSDAPSPIREYGIDGTGHCRHAAAMRAFRPPRSPGQTTPAVREAAIP